MDTFPKAKRLFMASLVLALASASGFSAAQTESTAPETGADMRRNNGELADAVMRIDQATRVVQTMRDDRDLAALVDNAKAVFVVPDYGRAALGVGARGGAGVLLVRHGKSWRDPAFYHMGGISAGLQAGVEVGAVALVLNNQKALNSFMQDNRFSLNADAGLTLADWSANARGAAGAGDITLWSDTKGLFGSAAVGVTDIVFDQKETSNYYERQVAASDVVAGKVKNPHARSLRQALANLGGGATGSMGSMGSSGAGATSSGDASSDTKKER